MKRFLVLFILIAPPPVFAQQMMYVHVVNLAGDSIAGATVTVQEIDGPQIGTDTTDAEGRAEIEGANPSRQYSARVTAVNYDPFSGPLNYPEDGRRVDDPVTIQLRRMRQPTRPPRPPATPRADQTITMDQAFFDDTTAAGWTHEVIGNSWLFRCQLFPGSTVAMPDGWVLRGGTHLWAFFASASCTFSLFGDRELNDPWTFVSYTIVDGRDSGLCPQDYDVNVMATPPAGNTAIPLVVSLTAGWSECHAAVSAVTVNGPEGANPMEAFVP